MKSTPTPLTKDEVHKLLDASSTNEENYIFIRLLAKTGRRIGEIYSLNVSDLHLDEKQAYAPVEKKARKQTRVMFLDNDTCLHLRRYITSRGLKKNDSLWSKSIRAYQYAIDSYAKKAGIDKKVMPHSFRHYVVTELRKQGWAWEDIAKITGHHPLSVRYYDHTDAFLKEGDFREASKEL